MRRISPRRYGLMLLAVVVTTLGLTTPARAAATTGSISGHLTDNGAPVAGASVYAYGDTEGAGNTTSTDATGFYQLNDLPPDSYRVVFQAMNRPQQFAPGKASYETASLFGVSAGGNTVVDDSLLPFGTISGRLVNAANNGLDGVTVMAVSPSYDLQAYTVTSSGDFSMAALPGQYNVRFDLPGSEQWAYGAWDQEAAHLFTVVAGQTTTVDDTALPTGSIAGTLLTAEGNPAVGVEVQAEVWNCCGFETTTTDEAGEYRLDGLAAADYRLAFTLPTGSTMWAPHARTGDQAKPVTVVADTVTTANDTLLPTGSVAGRFTAPGLGDIEVEISDEADNMVYTYADGDGRFRFDGIFTGDKYRVRFMDFDGEISQYAYGKVTAATAALIKVTQGGTTTVNDTRLATGSVKIIAKNRVTGAVIQRFSAGLGLKNGQTTTGALTLSGIAIGTHAATVYADGYDSSEEEVSVTVVAGQLKTITVSLWPATTIKGTVVDAATGKPVAGVCVIPQRIPRFSLGDGCGVETRADGTYTYPYLREGGDFRLFALPPTGSVYGGQWVGTTGGTGDQRLARTITVGDHATVTAPVIKLDKARIITGTVTSATGKPIQYGRVGIATIHTGVGSDYGYRPIDDQGKYKIEFLGPYDWPLLFEAKDHAMQWSGGKPDRFSAVPVHGVAGSPTTYNHTLQVGKLVSGVIRLPSGKPSEGYLNAHSAATGDFAGQTWQETGKSYQLRLLAPALVKFDHDGPYPLYSYVIAYGTMSITADRTIDFCVYSSTSMRPCDEPAPAPRRSSGPVTGTLPPRRH